jgi:hypothetical protein
MELNFLQAAAITLTIEGFLLYLSLRREYRDGIILRNVIVANALTLPLVWFFFPRIPIGYWGQITIAEIFAAGVEGFAYSALFRKMGLAMAIALSVLCNACSFVLGLAILYF